ncbi:hypothetical protein [Chitinophaga ginsengisoli]|uniref:Uncharacterized protein n=1 Tax=Chitinophaga ginsengisoli TaxID=363837 RepID=A0A2P8GLD8_9BACT|nr:hypothetical protein [Chitinophaga ginsengisoli]PSL34760.1 hypothetical protein CLV42_102333 [Chitinophaga ginsengisoli]
MNTLAYIIYLFITYLITVRVGFIFYRNGRLFILGLLKNDVSLTDAINRILLVGYYLVNLGYAALMISTWDTIITWTELLSSITVMTGKIVLTLAIMHYFNMLVIYLISKRNKSILHA